MSVTLIKTNGTELPCHDIKGPPSIQWAYGVLGYANRMIERLYVEHEGKPAQLLVDEEGLLYQRELNHKATVIYWAAPLARGIAREHLSPIVGHAILLTGEHQWKP